MALILIWVLCDEIAFDILELLLPRLTVEEFFEIIDKEKSASWEGGYKKAQYDIRKALGI